MHKTMKKIALNQKLTTKLLKLLRSYSIPTNYLECILSYAKTLNLNIYTQETFLNFLACKLKHNVPVEYIVNHAHFLGLKLYVNRCTHIPKPLTETLVENVLYFLNCKLQAHFFPYLKYLPTVITTNSTKQYTIIAPKNTQNQNKPNYKSTNLKQLPYKNTFNKLTIVDMGTGSGNIIISIAYLLQKYNKKLFDNTKFIATDIYDCTLQIAKQNAQKYKLDKKITFVKTTENNFIPDILLQNQSTLFLQGTSATKKNNIIQANPPAKQNLHNNVNNMTQAQSNTYTKNVSSAQENTLPVPPILWVTNPPYLTYNHQLEESIFAQPHKSLFEPKNFSSKLTASLKSLAKALNTTIYVFNEKHLFDYLYRENK